MALLFAPDPMRRAALPSTWTTGGVKAALREHETGDFRHSGLLADAMQRDPKIAATLDTRILGMLGLPFSMLPATAGDPRRTRKVAEQTAKWWRRHVRKSQLAATLRSGLMIGVGPGRLEWSQPVEGGPQIPSLRTWHPAVVRYDSEKEAFFAQTTDGAVEITPGFDDWTLYTPGGRDRPWMTGAVRALAIPWLFKHYAQNDWARALEVYGLGIRKATVPADAKQSLIDKFLDDIRDLANEPTIAVPDGFDVQVLMVEAASGEAFERAMNRVDAAITEYFLGQMLTTTAPGGGSYALGRVQQRVQLDRFEADVETLGDFAQEQVLEPYCEVNEGDRTLAPRPYYDTDLLEDKATMASTLMNASVALTNLVNIRAPIDLAETLKRLELPVLEGGRRGVIQEWHAKHGAVRKDEVREELGLDLLGAEGGGEDFLGGGDEGAPDEPPPGAPDDQPSPAKPPPDEDRPPSPTGPPAPAP